MALNKSPWIVFRWACVTYVLFFSHFERWVFADKDHIAFKAHSGPVNSFAFSANGSLLVTSSRDFSFKLWRILDRVVTEMDSRKHLKRPLYNLVFSQNTDMIGYLGPNRRTIQFATIEKGRIRELNFSINHEASLETNALPAFDFSSDGKHVAYSSVKDGAVEIWPFPELNTKQMVRLFDKPDTIEIVRFSYDCSKIASISMEGWLRIWSVHNGATQACWAMQLKEMTGVLNLAFSKSSTELAVAYTSQFGCAVEVLHVDCAEKKSRHVTIDTSVKQEKYRAAAFSPDLKTVVVGDNSGKIGFWDSAKRKRVRRLAINSSVQAIGVSPDGQTCAIGCWNGDVHVFFLNGKQ